MTRAGDVSRTKDFERYVAACTYPGVLDVETVQARLREYIAALKIERSVVRLDAEWSLERDPDLARTVDTIMADVVQRSGSAALDAQAARDARDAQDAQDALAAQAARAARDNAKHRFASWCIQGNGWYWWRWDLSWVTTTHLGAVQLRKPAVDQWARPLFEAFVAGAWFLYWTERTLYWIAKPTVHIELVDGRRRLHRADGPALESDIEPLYFWHGVLVPAEAITTPAQEITAAQAFAEPNAEVRRVWLARMGWERAVEGGTLVQEDARGQLWSLPLGDGREYRVVRVLNSTPEALACDGVGCEQRDGRWWKVYWLRVPAAMQTAQEAVAWSFGQEPDTYAPVAES